MKRVQSILPSIKKINVYVPNVSSLDKQYHLAFLYAQELNYNESIKILKKILEQDSLYFPAQNLALVLKIMQKKYSETKKIAHSFIFLSSKNKDFITLCLGIINFIEQKNQKANMYFKQILYCDYSYIAFYYLAEMAINNQDYNSATQNYLNAISIIQSNLYTKNNELNLFFETEEIIKDIQTKIELMYL